MNLSIRSSPSGKNYDLDGSLSSYGLQPSWFIDATNGSDDNPGTQAYPLRTMAELSSRLSGNFIQVPMTVQLVGDVIDSPMMIAGARFKLNATMTVSGTRTLLGQGSITTVTPIGNGGTTYPWQLTTQGIDWTAIPTNAQILLSQGAVTFRFSPVDANNVIVQAMTTTPGVAAQFTPTAGLSFQVFSLSRALPPMFNVLTHTTGVFSTVVMTWQNLSFDGPNACSVNGIGVAFQGCEFKNMNQLENSSGSTMVFRCCRFTQLQNMSFRAGGSRMNATACGFCTDSGSTIFSVSFNAGDDFFSAACSFLRMQVTVGPAFVQISTGGWFFDTVTTGTIVNLLNGARMFCTGSGAILNGRNCTGALFGIDITVGQYVWNSAANKPTLGVASGATNDVRLGAGGSALSFTYAALSTGKQYSQLDQVPPTTTQIQQGGYAQIGQTA